jgi:hypothetical protein
MGNPFKYIKAARTAFDIGKKYLPNATKETQKKFVDEVKDLQVGMTHDSAVSLALQKFRPIKKKNLGGGVASGPPPKRGLILKSHQLSYLLEDVLIDNQAKRMYIQDCNDIQLKGQKFRGVR